MEKELRNYLRCGILAHGFARARCPSCGYDFLMAARDAVEKSGLSKREMIRRLRTSPSQFYRLLDPTYYGMSVGRMVALLHVLGQEVDFEVRPLRPPSDSVLSA